MNETQIKITRVQHVFGKKDQQNCFVKHNGMFLAFDLQCLQGKWNNLTGWIWEILRLFTAVLPWLDSETVLSCGNLRASVWNTEVQLYFCLYTFLSGCFSVCSEIITYDSTKLNFSSKLYPWPLHLIAWFCNWAAIRLGPLDPFFACVPVFVYHSFKALKVFKIGAWEEGKLWDKHFDLPVSNSWRLFTEQTV